MNKVQHEEKMKSERNSKKNKECDTEKCTIERVQHEVSAALKGCHKKKFEHEKSSTWKECNTKKVQDKESATWEKCTLEKVKHE